MIEPINVAPLHRRKRSCSGGGCPNRWGCLHAASSFSDWIPKVCEVNSCRNQRPIHHIDRIP